MVHGTNTNISKIIIPLNRLSPLIADQNITDLYKLYSDILLTYRMLHTFKCLNHIFITCYRSELLLHVVDNILPATRYVLSQ